MHGWLVMSQGSIFITSDGGASWQPRSLASFGQFVADAEMADRDRLWASVGDRPMRSSDSGNTWQVVAGQRPGFLDFVDGETGWVASAACSDIECTGGVSRTTDGGTTWTATPQNIYQFYDVRFADRLNGWSSGTTCDVRGGTCDNQILRSGNGGVTWTVEETGTEFAGEFSLFDRGHAWFLPAQRHLGFGFDPYQRAQLFA
jgi:photosystem II stability/assembly factor-like uncharacterized protein